MAKLSNMYRTMAGDSFAPRISLVMHLDDGDQTLQYEKVTWNIDGEEKGLRYGENPDQPAALYRLVNGNLRLGDVETVQPGMGLASEAELLQSGKHPGKINITDADAALGILRYFGDEPATVIIKHNNPCGVALGDNAVHSYERAYNADRIAAFGGAVGMNCTVDASTAQRIADAYTEVVVAPDFTPDALDLFAGKKNLRVMRIRAMDRLAAYEPLRVVDIASLMDGGLVLQWSFQPKRLTADELIPAETERKGERFVVGREPTEAEKRDMIFGWFVEAGVTSNSVLYVKDQATVAIGTGEQDRVGVAEIARDKAYRKAPERVSFARYGKGFRDLSETEQAAVTEEVKADKAGLSGSCMISDAFFPFRDGIDVGLNEGVQSVLQPGGSLRDFESIEACNEHNATMCFTGQRSFRH